MPDPAISVLVVTPDDAHTMRHTLAALQRQTIRERIELVLIGPNASLLHPPDGLCEGFASVRRLEVRPFLSLGKIVAEGVRVATTRAFSARGSLRHGMRQNPKAQWKLTHFAS